ncbi:MAG: ATPase, partial [Candidatus Thiodiazotropha sp.]
LAQLSALDLSVRLSASLSSGLAFWRPGMVPWLLYTAVIFAFLCLFLIFRRNLLGNQVKRMEGVAQDLSAILDDLPEVDDVSPGSDDTLSGEVAEVAAEVDTTGAGQEIAELEAVDRAARGRLSQRITDWQASAQEVRDGVGGEQNQLRQELEAIGRRKVELDQAMAVEQARLEQAEQLNKIADDLQEKISAREQHIETCILAEQLIEGASREVSHRFNRKLRGLVSKTLPLFTENRYEHLQIEDDLSVRAFSSEKRDFMDLDEISSGTQRQIMLAVRLALSQELVARVVKQRQFLFLDEPFAFFDEKRTRSALTVLPTLSEELNQIWIIGQAFADDLHFDLHIQCERGRNAILLGD